MLYPNQTQHHSLVAAEAPRQYDGRMNLPIGGRRARSGQVKAITQAKPSPTPNLDRHVCCLRAINSIAVQPELEEAKQGLYERQVAAVNVAADNVPGDRTGGNVNPEVCTQLAWYEPSKIFAQAITVHGDA